MFSVEQMKGSVNPEGWSAIPLAPEAPRTCVVLDLEKNTEMMLLGVYIGP